MATTHGVENPETASVEAQELSSVPESTLDLLLDDGPEEGNVAIGRICAAVLAVVIGLAVFQSFDLGIGDLRNPGPGLWPMFISVVTLALTVVLLIMGAAWAETPQGGRRWVLGSIAALVVYSLLLPLFGFVIATIPLAFYFTKVIGGAGWITSVVTAIASPIAAFYVFDELLGVPMMTATLW